jgi:hypothetical protein
MVIGVYLLIYGLTNPAKYSQKRYVASVTYNITNKTMKDILFDFISKYVSLTEDEKNAILSLDLFRSVKKGTTLLKEGQKSQDSYFVLKGCIRTYYIIDGEEKTTAFYTEMEALTPPCVINKVLLNISLVVLKTVFLQFQMMIWG